MCGIVGFVGKTTREELSLMLSAISHRGPDESGIFWKENAGMGNVRLAIVGRADGHQPMLNASGTLVITHNGEIYNHTNLRKILEKRGYAFRTKTDTEVILAAYEEYGEKCAEKLEGMFAFAIWDGKKKQLFAARDRFGIKPFVYTLTPGKTFLFTSEIKSLLAHPKVQAALNPQALFSYLQLRFVPEPQTMFQNIHHLPAAHSLIVDQRGRIKITRYWHLGNNRSDINPREAAEEFLSKLTSSVQDQLMGEVPVGIFASGGIDSSLLTVLAHQKRKDIKLFSVSFPDARFDESAHAKLMADYLKVQLHTLDFQPEWVNLLPEIIRHLDQPLADAAVVPTYFLAKFARKYVGVVLSGDGSDEILAGYDRHKGLLIAHRIIQLIHSIPVLKPDLLSQYLYSMTVFSKTELQQLLTPFFWQLTKPADKKQLTVSSHFSTDEDFLTQVLKTDVETWLPGVILLKTDRMTMAHSLETRVPYLDHRLVEFIFSLPSSMKLRRFTGKFIQRLAAGSVVPKEIINRRKHGFDVPFEPFYQLAKQVLSPTSVKSRAWFHPEKVQEILSHSDRYRYDKKILALLMLELWARVFLDKSQFLISSDLPV